MQTIDKQTIYELEIQKSKFICYIDIVHNEDDAKNIIEKCKKTYPNATHYCYAYIIDNIKRFQDDGEPGGTAGMPILHVLESNNLQHIIAVVIRYFGGIKLGAGGLVRAYTNSVNECLQKTKIITLEKCQILHIEFEYNNLKQIDYLLQNHDIINKSFNEKVIYEIAVSKEKITDLLNNISTIISSYFVDKKITYNILKNE